MPNIDDLIVDLARKRAAAKEADEAYKRVWLDFQTECAPLLKAMNTTKLVAASADAVVRAAAVETYRTTGEFKPHPAIVITKRKKAVYDPQAILAWAISAIQPWCLKLDTVALEKEILQGDAVPPHLYEVVYVPVPAIQTLLGEYVLAAEAGVKPE